MSNIYVDKLNEAITVLGGEPATEPAGNVYVAKLDEVIASLTAIRDQIAGAATLDEVSALLTNLRNHIEGDIAVVFNNDGHMHLFNTNFNAVNSTGAHYIHSTGIDSPQIPGATQYYGFTMGLGVEYPTYFTQLYWPRTPYGGSPYVSVRFKEDGTWGGWTRISAGYADNAGHADSTTGYPGVSGLTTGQVLRATGGGTVAYGLLDLASAVTGTLADNRLSSNVPLKNASSNTFTGGMNVGSATGAVAGEIKASGTIATSAGKKWSLGGYTTDATDRVSNGYVTVTIDGVTYKLLTRA